MAYRSNEQAFGDASVNGAQAGATISLALHDSVHGRKGNASTIALEEVGVGKA